MIKIKDFTFASKNLGGGVDVPPCPTQLPPMVGRYILRSQNLIPQLLVACSN